MNKDLVRVVEKEATLNFPPEQAKETQQAELGKMDDYESVEVVLYKPFEVKDLIQEMEGNSEPVARTKRQHPFLAFFKKIKMIKNKKKVVPAPN